MGRLVKTAVALVAVLVVLFGGTLAYKHVTGKSSVADNQPPLDSWKTVTLGSFSVKVPHQPVKLGGSADSSGKAVYTLSADRDSLWVSVATSPQQASVDALVQATASGSNLQVASTTPATIGGKPAVLYRFVGTAGDQPVSAFGAAITTADEAIVVQYDVGGHPTTTPAFLQKVLHTVAFSG